VSVLDRLRHGLIVSVQAEPNSLLRSTESIVLLARVAERNGAAGLRVEGVDRLRAVRAAVAVPIIGLVKRSHAGFDPYITSTAAEVAEVAGTGAEIVAFDATARAHPDGASVNELAGAAHAAGCLAMADCATIADARAAIAAGCDLVATTLAGYAAGTKGRSLPAIDIVEAIRSEHAFVVCEGGIGSPEAAQAAFAAGASAIVVGTAITNIDALVRRFVLAAGQNATGATGARARE
jgi:N-acylglucosamine-6-phosphate 2-epimerase